MQYIVFSFCIFTLEAKDKHVKSLKRGICLICSNLVFFKEAQIFKILSNPIVEHS